MTKKPRLISPKLLALLLVVLGGSVYTFWQGRQADEAATVPVTTTAIKPPSSAAHKKQNAAPDSVFVNLFTTPPPPPAPPPSLEQKPSAPPLPFQLESTWQMGAETVLALRMNNAARSLTPCIQAARSLGNTSSRRLGMMQSILFICHWLNHNSWL